MSELVTRRTFLLAGATAAATVAVAVACGGDDDEGADVKVDEPTGTAAGRLAVAMVSGQFLAGSDQRVAFAVLRDGMPLPGGDDVTVAFGTANGSRLAPPTPARRHDEGIEARPYYVSSFRFPEPGSYTLQATTGGKMAQAALQVVDPASSKIPVPGRPMISVPTPTPADGRGVDPICTRQPLCPLHEPSLDAALGERRPLAVLFSTPALCQSATCGPVLEILLNERPAFAERVRFLHVEIFTDLSGKTLSPAVQAYSLEFEPILFLAGADRMLRERLDGAFDRAELRSALERLVA